MQFSFFTCLSLFSAIWTACSASDPTRLVYEFPKGTWLENLAVRPCGDVLLTVLTSPDLYLINPLISNPKPTLVHHFPSVLGLLGITETDPYTFYVVGGNLSFSTLSFAPDSVQIFRVQFRLLKPNQPAKISLTATLPDVLFPNSLIALTPTTLLLADSTKGAVWAIDTRTGSSRIAIEDPLFSVTTASSKIGINGIKLLDNTLYFTNGAQGIFGKVSINPTTGAALGPAKKISNSAPGASYDDFALSRFRDAAFLADGGGDSIAEVKLDTGKTTIIAGRVNTTEIAESTSAQFGRTVFDSDILYVTTAGGLAVPVNGDEVVGGQFVAVDTRGNL